MDHPLVKIKNNNPLSIKEGPNVVERWDGV